MKCLPTTSVSAFGVAAVAAALAAHHYNATVSWVAKH